jgi:hypothetical protein
MSEFKFACPVCGQHITCDSALSGSPMECPTCFRKLVVPQAPKDGNSKLVLTATEVDQRPRTTIPQEAQSRGPAKRFPVGVVLLLLTVLAVAASALFYRDDLLKFVNKTPAEPPPAAPIAAPSAPDSAWTLNLAGKKTPDAPAAGRIEGKPFALTRATVQGGTVNLRQGPKWPPDLGVTIHLFAKQGEELAGKTVNIDTTWTNAPRLTVRSKGETNQPLNRTVREGYAMRIEFGAVQNGQLPGKIYLSLPDEEHSWVAGNFSAEIRKPQATAAKQ